MKLNDQLFEDFSRMASGAASALSGLKDQFDARRHGATQTAAITREEFEVVAAMAAKARDIQADLLARIQALEEKLGMTNATGSTEQDT